MNTAVQLFNSEAMQEAVSGQVFGAWPEGHTYYEADQPREVGKLLVGALHRHLANASIGYVFREKMSDRDKAILGKAGKAGAKLEFFTDLDFLIEVNWSGWLRLSKAQRVALIDHELCHFGVEATEKGPRWVLLHHDVEEFSAIVQRWGLWRPDLREFAGIVSEQRDLFERISA